MPLKAPNNKFEHFKLRNMSYVLHDEHKRLKIVLSLSIIMAFTLRFEYVNYKELQERARLQISFFVRRRSIMLGLGIPAISRGLRQNHLMHEPGVYHGLVSASMSFSAYEYVHVYIYIDI